MFETFNVGAIPFAALAGLLAAFEWFGQRWIVSKNDAWRGTTRSDSLRVWSERTLQLFAILTLLMAVWVLTFDFR